MNHTVKFDKREDDAEIRLARFLAQLVREGVTYTIRQDAFEYEVEMKGGF